MNNDWNASGCHFFAQGQWQEAIHCFQQACQQAPTATQNWHNLGSACFMAQRFEAAEAAFCQARQVAPDNIESAMSLAFLYHQLKRYHQVIAVLEPLNVLVSDAVKRWQLLGTAYRQLHQDEKALTVFKQLLTLTPGEYSVLEALYHLYMGRQEPEQALPYARQLHQAMPTSAEWLLKVAGCLVSTHQYTEAEHHAHLAFIINPDLPDYYRIMSRIQGKKGSSKTLAILQAADERFPQDANWFRMMLLYGHMSPAISLETHAQWTQLWGERFAAQYYPANPLFYNPTLPDKKLRIGYVSADFNLHSAANVLSLLFEQADRQQYDIYAYYNQRKYDQATDFFKHHSHVWREIWHLDDEQVTGLIRNDEIDILVDLSGLTDGNRLLVFARKPAPIQFTGLGFGCSTGIRTMDYRFSDRHMVLPSTASLYPEAIAYLTSLLVISPEHYVLPERSFVLPMSTNGYLTLGYGNDPIKLNDQVLTLWSRLLHSIASSRLHFKYDGFEYEQLQAHLRAFFAQQGIAGERLLFSGQTNHTLHMEFYNGVDIVLDPFPYNGGISTLNALSMGLPVVTLETPNGNRASISLLQNLGLPELIAQSEAEYMAKVQELAAHPDKLLAYREFIPKQLKESVISQPQHFMQEVESVYRKAWHTWCEQAKQNPVRQKLLMGMQEHLKKNMAAAEQAYRSVLQREPQQADALHALGLLMFQRQEPACLTLLNKAIEFAPHQDYFWWNLGIVQHVFGQTEAATASFKKAIHLNRTLAEAGATKSLIFSATASQLAEALSG